MKKTNGLKYNCKNSYRNCYLAQRGGAWGMYLFDDVDDQIIDNGNMYLFKGQRLDMMTPESFQNLKFHMSMKMKNGELRLEVAE